MTASELQDLIVDSLARRGGGSKRRWRIALGPIRVHELGTNPHCNWSAASSGSAREVTEIERLLEDVKLAHPVVEADRGVDG